MSDSLVLRNQAKEVKREDRFRWFLDSQMSCPSQIKKKEQVRCWWLMPVILATQEAEIRKITV
jgi:hypothetical protein